MKNLYYCLDCRRVFDFEEHCLYCQSEKVKKLVKMTSINVIGSKLKGNVFNAKDGKVSVLLVDSQNKRYFKEFEACEIRKIL